MKKLFTIALIIIAIVFLLKVFGRANDPNWKFLSQLDPRVRRKFTRFLNDIKRLGYTPVIRESVRSYEQQQKYHQQDKRNAPAGHSSHEVGIAIDMDIYKNGKVLSKHTPKALWMNTRVPQLANEYGIRWGGNFKGYADNNHFDYLKV